jgi:hypothetical protein
MVEMAQDWPKKASAFSSWVVVLDKAMALSELSKILKA